MDHLPALDAEDVVWDGGSLAIPVAPLPGEGLAELLVRATAENSYGRCAIIPNAIGVRGSLPAGLATRLQGRTRGLATLLGVPQGVAALEPLLYLPAEGRAGRQTFFGTSIRQVYHDARRRRVSPRALVASPHLRAIWTLRVLPFDPSTKEVLLDRCPVCEKALGWARTRGVVFCDQCIRTDKYGCERGSVDLREYPQPVVDEQLWPRLDLLTGLVDPHPDVRASFEPVLPEAMRDFERGELFEFAIALASAFDDPGGSKWGYLARHAKKERHKRLTPELLALAATAISDWPKTFNIAVEQARNDEQARPGHFGRRKAFGAIAQLAVDHFIHPQLRSLVKSEVEKHLIAPRTLRPRTPASNRPGDLMPIDTARRTLGISKNRIARLVKRPRVSSIRTADAQKASVLVSVEELSAVIASDAELVSVEKAAARLGLPGLAVVALCVSGPLEFGVDNEGNILRQAVSRSSLNALVHSLECRVTRSTPPARALTLSAAAVHLGSPATNPWPEILDAIRHGRLNAWQTDTPRAAACSIYVVLAEAESQVCSAATWDEAACDPVVSHQDAARLLGTNVATFYALLDAGKVPRRPQLSNLQSFARENALTSELVATLGKSGPVMHPRNVVRLLCDREVSPVTPSGRLKNRLAWPRAQAEAVLADISAAWRCSAVGLQCDAKRWYPELLCAPATSIPGCHASERIGVPRIALPSLASAGLLSLQVSSDGSDLEVDPQSLNDLAGLLEAKCPTTTGVANAIPLSLAAVLTGAPYKNPWPDLVTAILDGSLQAMRCSSSGRLSAPVSVVFSLGSEFLTQDWSKDDQITRLTQADTARLLGTSPGNVTALVRDALLPQQARLADVQAFAKDFAFTLELHQTLKTKVPSLDPRMTVEFLRSSAFKPAAALTYKGALIWRRAEVARFIDTL